MSDEINISINFIVIFGADDTPMQIELTTVESSVVEHFRRYNQNIKLSDLYASLPHNRPAILSAVYNLCSKEILIDRSYGYYDLNNNLRCKFVTNNEAEKLTPQKTAEELAAEADKKSSDQVKALWAEDKAEGERRVKHFESIIEQEIAKQKKTLVLNTAKQFEQDLAETTATMNNLGFLAFMNKRACRKKIMQIQHDMEYTEESTPVVSVLSRLEALAKQKITDYQEQIDNYLNSRYIKNTSTETINPLDYYRCASGNEYKDADYREVLEVLREGSATLEEISEKIYTNQSVSAILNYLYKYELIELDWDSDECKYKLVHLFVTETTEHWSQSKTTKEMPMIPSIDNLFMA